MAKKLCGIILALFTTLVITGAAHSCVGRILYIGALNTDADKVMAELLVLLINERTGTNVKVRYFDNNDQLYTAFKSSVEEERVDIIIEDTVDAAGILKISPDPDPEKTFTQVKQQYEKELDVVWLNPFGFTKDQAQKQQTVIAPLIRRDTLTNFPLLPRVINKLTGAIDDKAYSALTASAGSGNKPKNIAKDFLRAQKLI